MGPEYHHIFTIWRIHNETAKHDSELLDEPTDILSYVHHKIANPEYSDWGVVDNQFVRYAPPKYTYNQMPKKLRTDVSPNI